MIGVVAHLVLEPALGGPSAALAPRHHYNGDDNAEDATNENNPDDDEQQGETVVVFFVGFGNSRVAFGNVGLDLVGLRLQLCLSRFPLRVAVRLLLDNLRHGVFLCAKALVKVLLLVLELLEEGKLKRAERVGGRLFVICSEDRGGRVLRVFRLTAIEFAVVLVHALFRACLVLALPRSELVVDGFLGVLLGVRESGRALLLASHADPRAIREFTDLGVDFRHELVLLANLGVRLGAVQLDNGGHVRQERGRVLVDCVLRGLLRLVAGVVDAAAVVVLDEGRGFRLGLVQRRELLRALGADAGGVRQEFALLVVARVEFVGGSLDGGGRDLRELIRLGLRLFLSSVLDPFEPCRVRCKLCGRVLEGRRSRFV